MKYLLILFVIALALAPLSHFFPSKRQRAVARMREHAAVAGLFVEFRDLPAGSDRQVHAGGNRTQVIYYGKRLPPSRDKQRPRLSWLRDGEGWRGAGHREPEPEGMRALPESIQALGVDEASCGIYWQEQGSTEDVATIVEVVEAWAEALSSRA